MGLRSGGLGWRGISTDYMYIFVGLISPLLYTIYRKYPFGDADQEKEKIEEEEKKEKK